MISPGGLRLEAQQVEKTPPCAATCTVGGDVRGWIGMIAQRAKLGLSEDEAYARAWRTIAAANPFPAVLGRICPHPCEDRCLRASVDGAVAINALERFLGDWALRHHLGLPILDDRPQPESIGVIGAGPAGLSFAYQMARRGYKATVYEKREWPGGMLSYCIPPFRLPADVLAAEVRRLLDLGVELRNGTSIGRDVSVAELRRRHNVVFVGIGAARGAWLGIPGERGDGVWGAVQYLSAMKRKEAVAPASQVVVIGGGNTAVDAARVARRTGAAVTILYRRATAEMPASAVEIDGALAEGVTLRPLSAVVRIERSRGVITGVVAQRMERADEDLSEQRPLRPIAQSQIRLPADCVIVAVSQQADWSGVEELKLVERREPWECAEADGVRIFVGGDALKPGLAGWAIAQGRRAAEAAHARLRGLPGPTLRAAAAATTEAVVKSQYYAKRERAALPCRGIGERLVTGDAEIRQTISEKVFLDESTRCLSCGLCFGCERCFMYCPAGAVRRLPRADSGRYFALDPDRCEGCGKCAQLCPSGFLSAEDVLRQQPPSYQ